MGWLVSCHRLAFSDPNSICISIVHLRQAPKACLHACHYSYHMPEHTATLCLLHRKASSHTYGLTIQQEKKRLRGIVGVGEASGREGGEVTWSLSSPDFSMSPSRAGCGVAPQSYKRTSLFQTLL